MAGIIKKEWIIFITGAGLILPIMLLLEYFLNRSFHPVTIIINNILFFVFICAPVMIVEQNEEKTDAYVFMAMLPVTKKEIVISKFLLVLATVIIVVGINCLNVVLFSEDTENSRLLQAVFLMNGIFTLLVTGMAYNGIFRMGYTRFLMLLGFISVVLGLVPPILISAGNFKPEDMFKWFYDFMNTTNWGMTVGFSLLVYIFLMVTAIACFSFERKNKEVHFLDF